MKPTEPQAPLPGNAAAELEQVLHHDIPLTREMGIRVIDWQNHRLRLHLPLAPNVNHKSTLFGGSLLRWIDEEAAIYAIVQLGNQRVVTKYISEINFVSASRQGDIIELGITATEFGRTSITLMCQVRNKITRKSILTVEKMVFVNLGEDGQPAPHGRTEIRYIKDQFDVPEQAVLIAPPRPL